MQKRIEMSYNSWKDAGNALGYKQAIMWFLYGRLERDGNCVIQYPIATTKLNKDDLKKRLEDSLSIATEMGYPCDGCRKSLVQYSWMGYFLCYDCRINSKIWFQKLNIEDSKDLRCEKCSNWMFDTLQGRMECRECNLIHLEK